MPVEPGSSRLRELASRARTNIDSFWREQLSGYRPVKVVIPYTPPAQTPCGVAEADNAAYCGVSEGVYYHADFLDRHLSDVGEFAPMFILAHEWGHHVQHLLGLSTAAAGSWPIQEELQADCLAGSFTRHASDQKLTGMSNLDQAALSLLRLGGRAPWFDPNAHGRPGQRLDAMLEGYNRRTCTADEFFLALGVDRNTLQLLPTPYVGSLKDHVERAVGRFSLMNVERTPMLVRASAVEALEMKYRAVNGAEVTFTLAAFDSPESSQMFWSALIATLAKNQAKEIRRSRVAARDGGTPLGSIVVMQGLKEIVLWTNEHLFGMVEGPNDVAWEFAVAAL